MIVTPPFYLSGEAGKSLGSNAVCAEVLEIQSGTLTLRNMDVSTLSFSQLATGENIIIDDGQWITLQDDGGLVLYRGRVKRTFLYPSRVYDFVCECAWRGLLTTPLTVAKRAFVLYDSQDLAATVADIMAKAASAGLPVRAPALVDAIFTTPKMAFRQASYASALEDALKWAQDAWVRLDFSQSPPALELVRRSTAREWRFDLDAAGNPLTALDLTAQPESHALYVELAYARRDNKDKVILLTQSAGDIAAEAHRKTNIYLSGIERTDMLVSEALTTAQKAMAMAQASVDAVSASIDAVAASAGLSLTWANLLARDTRLQAAVAAEPGFYMSPGPASREIYTAIACGLHSPWTGTDSYTSGGVTLRDQNGALATGWYPIASNSFSAGDLATAGATKATRYWRGMLVADTSGGSAGETALYNAASSDLVRLGGYTQDYTPDCARTSDYSKRYCFFYVNVAVDAINVAPSAVAAAVKAVAAQAATLWIERAEFVEAPADLAQNFFKSQDWTPFKGSAELLPGSDIPRPGDLFSASGGGAPDDWATAKTPIAEVTIQLETAVAKLTIGPPARLDFGALADRLRIPIEDNYQQG